MYFKLLITGIIFRVDHIHKKFIKTKNMKISMDYGEYNFSTQYENNSGKHFK